MSEARAQIAQLRATMNLGCQGDSNSSHGYEEVAVIGNGAYGTVYKARDLKNDGQFVAIKKIRIQTSAEEGMPMSTIREIAMLKQLENFEHPNIVRYDDLFRQSLNGTGEEWVTVYLPPATKLRQGNVFTPVCDSVHRRGVSVPACTTGHMTRGVSVQYGNERAVRILLECILVC